VTTPTVHFDPYDAAFLADPYPAYARVRSETPIAYSPDWDLTFMARHADVAAVLRDRRFGRQATHVLEPSELARPEVGSGYPTWERFIRGSFIDLEPPRHTRLRGLVARAFTRRSSEAMRPLVRRTAEELLDRIVEEGRMDVISDYATPIPLEMIADLMGIPDGDRERLLAWSHAIVRLFDYNATPEEGRAADEAVEAFVAYLRPIIRERRARPGDDLVSHMTQVDVDGDRLDEDDIVATSILTLNAGHEATVHAIGNGILALARDPAAYATLHADPGLAASAAEELLRYDTPLQMFERWVLEDLDWEGHRLSKGTKVGLLFGAANRDPDAFDHPDRLDVTRNDRTHVSFGGGIHHCVGAPLARVELEEAFAALARRVRSLELETDDLEYLPSLVFRGVTALPVSIVPA
jgi:cytochrome P450